MQADFNKYRHWIGCKTTSGTCLWLLWLLHCKSDLVDLKQSYVNLWFCLLKFIPCVTHRILPFLLVNVSVTPNNVCWRWMWLSMLRSNFSISWSIATIASKHEVLLSCEKHAKHNFNCMVFTGQDLLRTMTIHFCWGANDVMGAFAYFQVLNHQFTHYSLQ